jgi:hypothetical protein
MGYRRMHRKLSKSQIIKISIIIILMGICTSLLLLKDTSDDFIPAHISIIEEAIYNGRLYGDAGNIQDPIFYILGAQIAVICGFAPSLLMFLPIQLIPFAILTFAVLYRISGNPMVSALLTAIELCSGTSATGKLFFWPHGIGYILFFSILLLTFILLKQDGLERPSIFLTAIIISFSLAFSSYDFTAIALILFVVIIIILIISLKVLSKYNSANKNYDLPLRRSSNLWLIMFVIVFGLSNFVYVVFIPNFLTAEGLSSLDKFVISYFNPNSTASSLSSIMIHYPSSVSIIGIIKYGILAIIILIFCIVILKTIFKEKSLSPIYLFTFAYFLTDGIYAFIRIGIGGGLLFWYESGIFCIALFFRMSKKFRVWAFVALLVILLSIPIYYNIMDDSGFIDRDEYQFDSYKTPIQWSIHYNYGNPTESDELTRELFILYSVEYSIHNGDSSPLVDAYIRQHRSLSEENALALVQLSNDSLDSKYYILNQRLNSMSLQNWIIIESWKNSNDQINTNNQINKIYDVPLLSIYYSP